MVVMALRSACDRLPDRLWPASACVRLPVRLWVCSGSSGLEDCRHGRWQWENHQHLRAGSDRGDPAGRRVHKSTSRVAPPPPHPLL